MIGMTSDDHVHFARIADAADDPALCARLIGDYYRDEARAERMPRALIYMHVGMLVGIAERLHATVKRPV